MKGKGLENWVGVFLFAAILVLGIVGQLAGSKGTSVAGSALSKEPDGRRAAFLLLRDLGFEVDTWVQPPGALPRGPGLLWLPRIPVTLGMEHTSQDSDVDSDIEPEGRPLLGRLHDPIGYMRFMQTGGALVVPVEDATEDFLTEQLGIGELEGLFANAELAERDSAALRGGATFEVEWSNEAAFNEPGPASDLEWLLMDGAQRALAFEIPVGRGRLVMLGDDGFLANEALPVADHALLFVRLVEELARGAPILLDEYALGRWEPRSATSLATTARFGPITWHLFAVLLLFAWRHAWVREFPRDPEPLGAVSPLARARASASLYERAGRYDLLADALVDGGLRQIARRARVSLPKPADESDVSRTAYRTRLLEAIGLRCGLGDDLRVWHTDLLERDVRALKDLVLLEARLGDLALACAGAHSERSRIRAFG